jgi:hypothetical protein
MRQAMVQAMALRQVTALAMGLQQVWPRSQAAWRRLMNLHHCRRSWQAAL